MLRPVWPDALANLETGGPEENGGSSGLPSFAMLAGAHLPLSATICLRPLVKA